MNGILQQIVDNKRKEIDAAMLAVPLAQMQQQAQQSPRSIRSMSGALRLSATGIIAEFKRRSPSKGWINQSADASIVVPGYEQSGAAASSILTDAYFFGGSTADLVAARPLTALPLLRKEFIVSSYQLYQARLMGADAVLLIAACLSVEECAALASEAHALGLEVLLEIHTEGELAHLNPCVDMLGVNNRDLDTFHTDIATSLRLAQQMHQYCQGQEQPPLLVSESGISSADTVRMLRQVGFEGFLVGEMFMRTTHPAEALAQFINELQ